MIYIRIALFLWFFLPDAASSISVEESPRTLYHNLKLIDPQTETILDDAYILVEGEKIIATGQTTERLADLPMVTAATAHHDMNGLYALPGLIDTHAHVTLGPVQLVMDAQPIYMKAVARPGIFEHNARYMLSFGITTIRNPAGDIAQSKDYVTHIESGTWRGPEMLYAGEVIDRSAFAFEGLVVRPSEELSISQIVDRQAQAGVHYIKLYEALTEEDIAEGIQAAHRHGLKTIAHLSDVSWTRAMELGIDALVHMMPISPELLPAERRDAYLESRRPGSFAFFEWFEAVDLESEEIQQMIAMLAESKIHIDATLSAFKPAFWGNDAEWLQRDVDLVHPDMLENWTSSFRFDLGWQADDYQRAQAIWPKVLQLTRMMFEAGVPMTIGTDFAMPYVAPGISMMREMQLHRDAGIPAWAILRMATGDAARVLEIDDRTGRIQPGLEADIVLLASDPSTDLAHLAEVRAVIDNGRLYDPEALRIADEPKDQQP